MSKAHSKYALRSSIMLGLLAICARSGASAAQERDPASVAASRQGSSSSAMSIPASMRGRWGLTLEDCNTWSGGARGLLTILAARVIFHGKTGVLAGIAAKTDASLRASFDMTGEIFGMNGENTGKLRNWERDMSFTLEENGARLIRREQGPDSMKGIAVYLRCPD